MQVPADPLSDDELQRFVDGALDAARQAEIEARLVTDADAARRVRQLLSLNVALHKTFDPVLVEPLPLRLTQPLLPRRGQSRWALAATVILMVTGTALGWLGHAWYAAQTPVHEARAMPARANPWARQAALAHAAFAPEVRHPVEVGVQEEAHLVAWLSKRVGAPLKPPPLKGQGFELMGGRLLPGDDTPVAQFMYQNAEGERLTLLLTRKAQIGADTAFQFYDERGVQVFYWIDGDFGYALSGAVPRERLLGLATSAYRAVNP